MSRMSFMEWVGLFIVVIALLDFFQNGEHSKIGKLLGQDKAVTAKKSPQ